MDLQVEQAISVPQSCSDLQHNVVLVSFMALHHCLWFFCLRGTRCSATNGHLLKELSDFPFRVERMI